jgi:hypothetical protein
MSAIRALLHGKGDLESPVSGNESRHGDLAVRRATPGSCHLGVFMNRGPRFAVSRKPEVKQTLLDHLRALAGEDPDFLTDLIEGETNLLELITALIATSTTTKSSSTAPKPPWTARAEKTIRL